MDLNGEPTDASLMLLQAEYLMQSFSFEGSLCSLQTDLANWAGSISLEGFHNTSVYTAS